MVTIFKNLFGSMSKNELRSMLDDGKAVLLDVRTEEEYRQAHADRSINIPLDTLTANLSKLETGRAVIAVCQSGMRSGNAVHILKRKGYKDVYNGGSWNNFK